MPYLKLWSRYRRGRTISSGIIKPRERRMRRNAARITKARRQFNRRLAWVVKYRRRAIVSFLSFLTNWSRTLALYTHIHPCLRIIRGNEMFHLNWKVLTYLSNASCLNIAEVPFSNNSQSKSISKEVTESKSCFI